MSDNGSKSGVTGKTNLQGVRASSAEVKKLTKTEIQGILNSKASEGEGVVKVIYADFSGGGLKLSLNKEGLANTSLPSIQSAINFLEARATQAKELQAKTLKESGLWSTFQRAKAQENAANQLLSKLNQAKKRKQKG